MHSVNCPVCQQALSTTENERSAACINGHMFDFAKQGYLNLLLSQQKKSKSPGDDSQMVKARTEFLNAGYYQIISDFLCQIISSKFHEVDQNICVDRNFSYTDIACGEGFYSQAIDHLLQRVFSNKQVNTTGIDISVPAIKAACARSKRIVWLVASMARMPLNDRSQDLITGLFFHFDYNEIERALKEGGLFISLTTGPNHLIELREKLYDTIKPEGKNELPKLPDGLAVEAIEKLTNKVQIKTQSDIGNLLKMTPHYWRAKQHKKDALLSVNSLDITIDIQATIIRKINHL